MVQEANFHKSKKKKKKLNKQGSETEHENDFFHSQHLLWMKVRDNDLSKKNIYSLCKENENTFNKLLC